MWDGSSVFQMSWSSSLHVGLGNVHKPCEFRTSFHATSCKEQGLMYSTAYKQFGIILDSLNKDLNRALYGTHHYIISALSEPFLI